jgi:5'-methylthioadenosine phosphorylase
MTAMPEARLAREAELPYSVLALATDYDAWHESEEDVNVAAVVATMKKNVVVARRTLAELAKALPDPTKSNAVGAARSGIMTHDTAIDPDARKRLDWLLGAATSR